MNMKIRAKQFVLLSLLSSLVGAMELSKFKEAVLHRKTQKLNLTIDQTKELIKEWGEDAKKLGEYGPLLTVISNNHIDGWAGMLLSFDGGLCYEYHERLKHTPIYLAVTQDRVPLINLLMHYHKWQGEPDDLNEYGFYGKNTLKAVISRNNPAIIAAFKDLQERKIKRGNLNARIEKECNRLLNVVQTHTKYRDITYLVSVQRYKS